MLPDCFSYTANVLSPDERDALAELLPGLDYHGNFQGIGLSEPKRWSWCAVASFGQWVVAGRRFPLRMPEWPEFLRTVAERAVFPHCPNEPFARCTVARYPAGNPILGRYASLSSGRVRALVLLKPALLKVYSVPRAGTIGSEFMMEPGSLLVIRGQESPQYSYWIEPSPGDYDELSYSVPIEVDRESPGVDWSDLADDPMAKLCWRVGWSVQDLRVLRTQAAGSEPRYSLFSQEYGRVIEPAVLPPGLIEELIAAGVPIEQQSA